MIPSPGRLLYLFRQNCREGWTTPYYRDHVRPRILSTRPILTAADGDVEVHVLTRQDDLLNLLWALKSFYHYSDRDYPLAIHEDGTLNEVGAALLRQHFPAARLIRRTEADAAMLPRLQAYPRCAQYRSLHPLARKAFDVGYYLQSPLLLLLDTDLIFFAPPVELVRRAEATVFAGNVFNADVAPGLNITTADAQARFGINLPDRVNSGLGLLRREVLNLDWMEEFLGCESLLAGHIWRVEQTLLALAAARDGVSLLPSSYRVSLQPGIEGCVVKHYVGAVRHLMYREGMARLNRAGFLAALHTAEQAPDRCQQPA